MKCCYIILWNANSIVNRSAFPEYPFILTARGCISGEIYYRTLYEIRLNYKSSDQRIKKALTLGSKFKGALFSTLQPNKTVSVDVHRTQQRNIKTIVNKYGCHFDHLNFPLSSILTPR